MPVFKVYNKQPLAPGETLAEGETPAQFIKLEPTDALTTIYSTVSTDYKTMGNMSTFYATLGSGAEAVTSEYFRINAADDVVRVSKGSLEVMDGTRGFRLGGGSTGQGGALFTHESAATVMYFPRKATMMVAEQPRVDILDTGLTVYGEVFAQRSVLSAGASDASVLTVDDADIQAVGTGTSTFPAVMIGVEAKSEGVKVLSARVVPGSTASNVTYVVYASPVYAADAAAPSAQLATIQSTWTEVARLTEDNVVNNVPVSVYMVGDATRVTSGGKRYFLVKAEGGLQGQTTTMKAGVGVTETDFYFASKDIDMWPGVAFDDTDQATTGTGFVGSVVYSTNAPIVEADDARHGIIRDNDITRVYAPNDADRSVRFGFATTKPVADDFSEYRNFINRQSADVRGLGKDFQGGVETFTLTSSMDTMTFFPSMYAGTQTITGTGYANDQTNSTGAIAGAAVSNIDDLVNAVAHAFPSLAALALHAENNLPVHITFGYADASGAAFATTDTYRIRNDIESAAGTAGTGAGSFFIKRIVYYREAEDAAYEYFPANDASQPLGTDAFVADMNSPVAPSSGPAYQDIMVVNQVGRVGVLTTAPDYDFHVQGEAFASSAMIAPVIKAVDEKATVDFTTSEEVNVDILGANVLKVDASGAIVTGDVTATGIYYGDAEGLTNVQINNITDIKKFVSSVTSDEGIAVGGMSNVNGAMALDASSRIWTTVLAANGQVIKNMDGTDSDAVATADGPMLVCYGVKGKVAMAWTLVQGSLDHTVQGLATKGHYLYATVVGPTNPTDANLYNNDGTTAALPSTTASASAVLLAKLDTRTGTVDLQQWLTTSAGFTYSVPTVQINAADGDKVLVTVQAENTSGASATFAVGTATKSVGASFFATAVARVSDSTTALAVDQALINGSRSWTALSKTENNVVWRVGKAVADEYQAGTAAGMYLAKIDATNFTVSSFGKVYDQGTADSFGIAATKAGGVAIVGRINNASATTKVFNMDATDSAYTIAPTNGRNAAFVFAYDQSGAVRFAFTPVRSTTVGGAASAQKIIETDGNLYLVGQYTGDAAFLNADGSVPGGIKLDTAAAPSLFVARVRSKDGSLSLCTGPAGTTQASVGPVFYNSENGKLYVTGTAESATAGSAYLRNLINVESNYAIDAQSEFTTVFNLRVQGAGTSAGNTAVVNDGDVTTPSVRGTDTDTGIFFQDGLKITHDGVEKVAVDSTGMTVKGKLFVTTNVAAVQVDRATSAASTAFHGTAVDSGMYFPDNTTVSLSTAGVERVKVTDQVDITGKTVTTDSIQVNKVTSATATSFFGPSADTGMFFSDSTTVSVAAQGVERMIVSADGIDVNGKVQVNNGTVTAPAIHGDMADTGIFFTDTDGAGVSDRVSVTVNGTMVFDVDSVGAEVVGRAKAYKYLSVEAGSVETFGPTNAQFATNAWNTGLYSETATSVALSASGIEYLAAGVKTDGTADENFDGIRVAGQVVVEDGAVAKPALRGTDADTGLFFATSAIHSGSNTVEVGIAGTVVTRTAASGFDVIGDIHSTSGIFTGGTTAGPASRSTQVVIDEATKTVTIKPNSTGTAGEVVIDVNGVVSTDRVKAPTYELDAYSTSAVPHVACTLDIDTGLYFPADGKIALGVAGGNIVMVEATGMTVQSNIRSTDSVTATNFFNVESLGAVGTPNVRGPSSVTTTGGTISLADSGMYFALTATETPLVNFSIAGIKKMEINSSGIIVTGGVTASGDITAYSDRRLKKDILPLPEDTLDRVLQVEAVSFKMKNKRKDGDRTRIGFVAQQLQECFPELVSPELNGYLSVSYGNMTSVLVKALQQLHAKVEDLEARLAAATAASAPAPTTSA